MEKMKTLTVGGTTFVIYDDGAVRYDTAQDLPEEKKAQARENIGAATVADVLAALPAAEGGSF